MARGTDDSMTCGGLDPLDAHAESGPVGFFSDRSTGTSFPVYYTSRLFVPLLSLSPSVHFLLFSRSPLASSYDPSTFYYFTTATTQLRPFFFFLPSSYPPPTPPCTLNGTPGCRR